MDVRIAVSAVLTRCAQNAPLIDMIRNRVLAQPVMTVWWSSSALNLNAPKSRVSVPGSR